MLEMLIDTARPFIGYVALILAALVILFVLFDGAWGKSRQHLANHTRRHKDVVARMKALRNEREDYITFGWDTGGYQLTDLGKTADTMTMAKLRASQCQMVEFINQVIDDDYVNPREFGVIALFLVNYNRRKWQTFQRECEAFARAIRGRRHDINFVIQ